MSELLHNGSMEVTMRICAPRIKVFGFEWRQAKEEPVCFYRLTDAGVWYPDVVTKPFLRGAVEELLGLERQYRRLSSLFGREKP
jgi:hypothetical protein